MIRKEEIERALLWNCTNETDNPRFWICWHACMLYLHGVFSYEQFDKIYQTYRKCKISS